MTMSHTFGTHSVIVRLLTCLRWLGFEFYLLQLDVIQSGFFSTGVRCASTHLDLYLPLKVTEILEWLQEPNPSGFIEG
jgi:hypothetical protein